jgi:gamma-glutamyltranspeptidase/glutathione hydrolase
MTTGGILYLESGISPDIRRELGRRGHRIQDINSVAYGGYQAVSRDPVTGVLSAASESRKDGCAMGY